MDGFTFYAPTRVIFGKDAELQAGTQVKAFGGSKVLIHYGSGSVVKSGLLDRVKKSLDEAGLAYVELGGAVPNPRLSKVYEGIELCRKEGVDFILGVGGGSAVDSAKAIAMGVCYDGDVWDIYDMKHTPAAGLPHGHIITLAATGSEMSNSAVITKDEGLLKRGVNTDFNRPRFALMNPELLYTLPPYQTACGVVDIMMHTLERFFSKGGCTEVSDRIATAIFRTVIDFGPVCMREPENYDARSEIMWAGSISHNHLTGLGRGGDWASHKIEMELSGKFDVAHGAGLAAIWGSWARYVMHEDIDRFVRYAKDVWGIEDADKEKAALAGIEANEAFFKSLDMPVCISELIGRKATEEEMRDMAVKATYFGRVKIGGFKVLGEDDIYNIYEMANH